MKKKISLSTLIFIVFIVGLYSTACEDKSYQYKFRSDLPIDKLAEKLSDQLVWKTYLASGVALSDSTASQKNPNGFSIFMGDTTLNLTLQNPYTVKVSWLNERKKALHLIIQVTPNPDTANRSFVNLTWNASSPAQSIAERIKAYCTQTERMYGYHIEKTLTKDSNFLFKSTKINAADLYTKLPLVFDSLIQYANLHQLKYDGVRIFNIQQIDSLRLILNASIAINSPIYFKMQKGFELKQMPFRKNLLSAHYTGYLHTYGSALDALDLYRTDHGIVTMAMPFVELPKNAVLTGKKTEMDVLVNYPFL